jgi:hypothetical protein
MANKKKLATPKKTGHASKMKSACAGCNGVILFEKDSTGQPIKEANLDEYANICETCKTKPRRSEREGDENRQGVADFDDERNKAMRTGGETNQTT